MTAIFISHSSADNAAAEEMVAWLATKGHTSLFLDFDPDAGIIGGGNWEQTLYQKVRQCQAMIALLTPSWLASKWCFAELAQARASGKTIFPVKVRPCETLGVFGDIQQIDLVARPEEGYRQLEIGLKNAGLDPLDIFDWDPSRPPYPGLLAFQEDEAAIFFGRGEEVQQALEALEALRRHGRDAARCLLVLGASGSGKSSLARAGIIPRLKKQPSAWLTVPPMRPQDDPIEELGVALSSAFARHGKQRTWDELRALLDDATAREPVDGRVLLHLLRDLTLTAQQPEATVLLTIDQMEELFGYTPPDAAERFLTLLRSVLEMADRRCIVLVTLRSDFLGEFQSHPVLQDRAGVHRGHFGYQVLPLDPMALRNFPQIISGPARLCGLQLEDGLVETMVRDTATRDALPLLAFTLRRLYERHSGHGMLTISEYDAIGGLEGAIREEAERLLAQARPAAEELAALHAAFVPAMIRIDAEGGYARRRARLADLPPNVVPLLRQFVDARLLVAGQDQDGQEVIEVAHEALLRTWPQLATWLAEDHDKLRLLEALQRAAVDWDDNGRPGDLLVYRDARLQDAAALLADPRFATPASSVEPAYVLACEAAQRERECAARQEQERRIRDAERIAEEQRRTAAVQRTITRRTRIGLAVTLALGAVAAMSALLALMASDEARVNLHRQLLQEAALQILRGNTPQAVANAIEAGGDLPGPAVRTLSRAFASNRLLALAQSAGTRPEDVRFPGVAADGTQLATITPEQGPVLWRLDRGRYRLDRDLGGDGLGIHSLVVGHAEQILGIGTDGVWRLPAATDAKPLYPCGTRAGSVFALSPDRHRLAIAVAENNGDDGVCVLDLTRPGEVLLQRMLSEGEIRHLAFSPNGDRLITASAFGRSQVFDLANGRHLLSLPAHGPLGRPFNAAVFDAAGERIAVAAVDERVRLYRADGTPLAELSESRVGGLVVKVHRTAVRDVSFATSGDFLVAVDDEGQVVRWSLDGSEQAVVIGSHELSVADVDIAPASSWEQEGQSLVLTGSLDHTARLWSLETGEPVAVLGHDGAVTAVGFTSDGRRLTAFSARDGAVRLWSVAPVTPLGSKLLHSDHIWDVATAAAPPALAPNGHALLLATAGFDGRVSVWRYGRTVERAVPELLQELVGHTMRVRDVTFGASGRLLASAAFDGTARVYDLITEQRCQLQVTDRFDGEVHKVLFGPDETWLLTASGDTDRPVRLFSVPECAPLADMPDLAHGNAPVEAAALLAVGGRTLVATGDAAGTFRVFVREADGGWRKGCELSAGVGAIGDIALDTEGRLAVIAGTAATAELLELDRETGLCTAQRQLIGHSGRVYSVAIASGGGQLLTASLDKTARIWDHDGAPLAILEGHQDRIYRAAFSPDGRWILTASRDGTIRLWRSPEVRPSDSAEPVVVREEFLPLDAGLGAAAEAAFSPDGHYIVGGYWENAAMLWRIWRDGDEPPKALRRRWGDDRARLALIGEAYRFRADNVIVENAAEQRIASPP